MARELSDPLTEEDKVWLRSWNRQGEIPDEEPGRTDVLVPGSPPGGETNPVNMTGGGSRPADEDPFGGEEPPEDYNDWTGDQLRWELGNRELPKTGKNADLVARLEEDDANNPDDNG